MEKEIINSPPHQILSIYLYSLGMEQGGSYKKTKNKEKIRYE